MRCINVGLNSWDIHMHVADEKVANAHVVQIVKGRSIKRLHYFYKTNP